ncbi:MAG: hypothetical protein U0237_08405 [Thermoleophilia bacterium]
MSPNPPDRAVWRRVARVQGWYLLVTGVWPLIHMRSFVALTGPKRDLWLVRSTGAALGAVGAALLAADARGRVDPPTALAGCLTAAGLAAVDLSPGPPGTISRMYRADGIVEAAFTMAWIVGAIRRRRRASRAARPAWPCATGPGRRA